MLSFKSIVLIAAAVASSVQASGVVGVAAPLAAPLATPFAAPLVAPAQVGYAHAVPDNVPPYASQINVETRAVNLPYASYAAYAAPSALPYASPYALPGPYAGYAAPYPYAAPLIRSAFGLAPAFVR